jgi:hypothetical protein
MSPSRRWLLVIAGLLMIVRGIPAAEAPLPPDTAQIKGTLAALGDPATLLALISDGVARDQLPQEGAATLISAAAEACSQEDERAGNVALLKKMYGNLARLVFARVLESDRRAEKRSTGVVQARPTLAKGA